MKRLLSANSSEILAMTRQELKQSIAASEGRTIVSENVVVRETMMPDVTNTEIATAFGADLILLNMFDVFKPFVAGLYSTESIDIKKNMHIIDDLHHLVGRPIGLNLEPVDPHAKMSETQLTIPMGRQANAQTVAQAEKLGFDFLVLTGNPETGVTNQQIIANIEQTRKLFSGLLIAGKMHSSGVEEPIIDISTAEKFINAGADVLLIPAVGTVPGLTDSTMRKIVAIAHKNQTLVMSTIGTSQESSSTKVIEQIAIRNKINGVDIQHIGDNGDLAPVENIITMSKAIRGMRHTVSRMARSINR